MNSTSYLLLLIGEVSALSYSKMRLTGVGCLDEDGKLNRRGDGSSEMEAPEEADNVSAPAVSPDGSSIPPPGGGEY